MKDTNYACVASVCGFYNVSVIEFTLYVNKCKHMFNESKIFANINTNIQVCMNMGQMSISSYFNLQILWEKLIKHVFSRSHSCFSLHPSCCRRRNFGCTSSECKGPAGLVGWPVPAGNVKTKISAYILSQNVSEIFMSLQKKTRLYTIHVRKSMRKRNALKNVWEDFYVPKYFIGLNFARVVVYFYFLCLC